MKVLVARCDRLGDLVLSLPVFAWLHGCKPDWEIHALVAPPAVPLIEHDPAIGAFYTWNAGPADELAARLAEESYDAAILLQYRSELAWLLRRAGIRRRYGPWSKLSSWLLLNRGHWQRRSRRFRHERDFNCDLARPLVGRDGARVPVAAPRLHLSEAQRELGRLFRRQEAAGAEVLAFVHPGSGGSALDYPPASFARVANALAQQAGWRVYLTGSHRDRAAIDAMTEHLDSRIKVLVERFPLRDFLGVLSAGDLMIAPSTGPLHLAAALDLAVVGVYPPAPTIGPGRWGPLGRWVRVVTPPLGCPARRHCLLTGCLFYNCLETITPQSVSKLATDVATARLRDLAEPGPAA